MVISPKTLDHCYSLLSDEWISTREIMAALGIGRGHTLKVLNSLKRDKLIKKKQEPHNFNTCNKKTALWARK